jgi:hypothetical protein
MSYGQKYKFVLILLIKNANKRSKLKGGKIEVIYYNYKKNAKTN